MEGLVAGEDKRVLHDHVISSNEVRANPSWKTLQGEREQNYAAIISVLKIP